MILWVIILKFWLTKWARNCVICHPLASIHFQTAPKLHGHCEVETKLDSLGHMIKMTEFSHYGKNLKIIPHRKTEIHVLYLFALSITDLKHKALEGSHKIHS